MSAPKFIYSGKCRQGDLGLETPFTDINGERLFVGDIVLLYATDGYAPEGLTAVVCDQYQSYSDGTHILKDGDPEFFVMGIKSVPLDDPGVWRVRRVKRWTDAVDGEHWTDYGFSYQTT